MRTYVILCQDNSVQSFKAESLEAMHKVVIAKTGYSPVQVLDVY